MVLRNQLTALHIVPSPIDPRDESYFARRLGQKDRSYATAYWTASIVCGVRHI